METPWYLFYKLYISSWKLYKDELNGNTQYLFYKLYISSWKLWMDELNGKTRYLFQKLYILAGNDTRMN